MVPSSGIQQALKGETPVDWLYDIYKKSSSQMPLIVSAITIGVTEVNSCVFTVSIRMSTA